MGQEAQEGFGYTFVNSSVDSQSRKYQGYLSNTYTVISVCKRSSYAFKCFAFLTLLQSDMGTSECEIMTGCSSSALSLTHIVGAEGNRE